MARGKYNAQASRFRELIFYDSRDPLDCDLLLDWSGLNVQLSEQFVRKWVPRLTTVS